MKQKTIDELEEFDEKLRFRVIKNRFLEGWNSIEEEIELRKITRKIKR